MRGRVLPATTEPVVLKAGRGLRSGRRSGRGDGDRPHPRRLTGAERPSGTAPTRSSALADADQIVLGPGSLFTSVLAAIAVPEIREGIERSGATKVYVCNLRPQVPETEDFDVAMHVEALAAHGVSVDVVLADTSGLPLGRPSTPVVGVPLARPNGLAHDPGKLAAALSDLLK